VDSTTIAVVAAGYLLGSVDFGVIVPRLLGTDIYAEGSGNPGASNVLRSMGRGTAAVVLLGDIAKGVAAAALGDILVGVVVGFAAGFAAAVGHCFPIWHGLRGGKGVAAAGGMTLWLEPALGVVLLVAWVGLVGLTKRASVASLLVVVALVPGLAVFGHREWSLAWAAATSLLVVARHHHNIRRLLGGAEYTVESDPA
jgi:glycerol-3-phosphate acyltransferase PlsY